MKRLLLACLLLQGLFLQKVDATTIRSGSFQVPLHGIFSYEYPVALSMSGDGFSTSLSLYALGQRPSDTCCYGYGSTQEIDFPMYPETGFYTSRTNGFLFNDTAYNGLYLWGPNFTFSGTTPEDKLQQNSARPTGFRVTATPVVFPNPGAFVPIGQGPVLTGTFELTGSLCGYLTGTGDFGLQPCVFDMPTVYGRGTYELTTNYGNWYSPTAPGYWGIKSLIFTFTDPGADVPEPATWATMAAGLLGLTLFRTAKGIKQ